MSLSIPSGVYDLLNRVSQRLGFAEPLAFDEAGATGIELASGALMGLRYDEQSDAMVLFADIGEPPAGAAALTQLLRANFDEALTGGAALALADDPSGAERLALVRSLPWRALDDETFTLSMDHFATALVNWRAWLATESLSPQAGDTALSAESANSLAAATHFVRG